MLYAEVEQVPQEITPCSMFRQHTNTCCLYLQIVKLQMVLKIYTLHLFSEPAAQCSVLKGVAQDKRPYALALDNA